MTATDELRRLLDERGVEWWETVVYISATITSENIERHYIVSTWWDSPVFGRVEAADMGGGGVLHMTYLNGRDFTPAQAVEATLGRGTCKVTDKCKCSVCGWQYPCRNYETYETCDGRVAYRPSFRLYNECGTVNFCPNCGRRVVGA